MPTPSVTKRVGWLCRWLIGGAVVFAGCAVKPPVPVEWYRQRIALPDPIDRFPPLPPEPPSSKDEEILPLPTVLPVSSRVEVAAVAAGVMTLDEAIAFAQQNNPRLRIVQESIEQARGGKEVAFAPFLPILTSSYRFVASATSMQGFSGTDLPFVIGFGPGTQDFQLAELHLQWTIYDFGRTCGRYEQASARVEIAQLQSIRASQTVTFDVSAAYYRLLRDRASHVVAAQALKRGEAILEIADSLFRNGVFEKDQQLRAEVQVAEARQALVAAQSAELVAVAALNLVMGANVNECTKILDIADEPHFDLCLADCLQTAVDQRREFQVAQQSIYVAQQGAKVAHADFRPRIFVRGTLANVQGSGIDTGNVEIGGIHLDWSLFEGGRRLGELRSANAEVRAKVAQAQLICDTIAFEVNEAYRAIDDNRQRIVLARTAATQAEENLRLVTSRYRNGAATPTDIVDAETTLTRAQQSYYTAVYDYRTALARLEYAMGTNAFTRAGRKGLP